MIWDILVRGLAGAISFVAFYLAWCVYEDEEKALQNRIENLWVDFDDLRGRMVSRQTAFVLVVASKLNEILTSVFGGSLISQISWAVVTCLSLTACIVCLAIIAAVNEDWSIVTVLAIIAFGLVFVGLAPARSAKLRYLQMAVFYVVIVSCLAILVTGIWFQHYARLHGFVDPNPFTVNAAQGLLEIPLGCAVGVGIAQVTVFCVRACIVWSERLKSETPIVLGVAIPLVFVAVITYLMFKFSYYTKPCGGAIIHADSFECIMIIGGRALLYAVPTVTFCAAFAAILLMTAALMLLHRLTWPLLSRLLYNVSRSRVLENKRWLNGLGLTLLGVALSGQYGWSRLLKFLGL
ncbi:hypothetical protein [Caballeronia sp. RCC_10]|uniref:hypothetical protein n=1 Tax=Caballeronia sp. RCC_10 TaxID=3239227 RepID=UPI00352589D5